MINKIQIHSKQPMKSNNIMWPIVNSATDFAHQIQKEVGKQVTFDFAMQMSSFSYV